MKILHKIISRSIGAGGSEVIVILKATKKIDKLDTNPI